MMRKLGFAVLILLAAFGVLELLALVVLVPTSCQQITLASSTSPNGSKIAKHVETTCGTGEPTREEISVGPQTFRSGDHTYSVVFREWSANDIGRKNRRLRSAILWWDSDEQLFVVYPATTGYLDELKFGDVTVTAVSRTSLRLSP